MNSEQTLFEDIFNINSLNNHGKKFERVNRLHCNGTTTGAELVLDVNCELFICRAGDSASILLASSIGLDSEVGYNPAAQSPLLDAYEYVMHGRVFAIKHIENQMVEVQASFGGLLFRLRGEQARLEKFSMDMTFFLLMRKTSNKALGV